VTITINGERREIGADATVQALLERYDVSRTGSAVALNDDVVPRGCYADTALHDGDRIEIIVAVAGG
jgi:sulfur carrier protein